ncbi:MAG: hypothetical protein IIY47_04320 [Solobacterium sp.]|nr:hypothetical protein [Solobacterium sp.]
MKASEKLKQDHQHETDGTDEAGYKTTEAMNDIEEQRKQVVEQQARQIRA